MNPTTDSQALLTKTFLHFTPLFFFFFCFLPCHLSLPNSNSTPLFPIPYYYVQLMSNYRSTKHLYSLYLSFYFFYLYKYIMQGSKSHKHSHKAKNPKQKKKHKEFSSAASNTSTKSPNQFSNFSSSVKTQTRNTQTPQAQFL